ncbi:MAG: hypothetical protein ACOC1X_02775 [Promethearchaeota archaeon]
MEKETNKNLNNYIESSVQKLYGYLKDMGAEEKFHTNGVINPIKLDKLYRFDSERERFNFMLLGHLLYLDASECAHLLVLMKSDPDIDDEHIREFRSNIENFGILDQVDREVKKLEAERTEERR